MTTDPKMTQAQSSPGPFRVNDLTPKAPTPFDTRPDAAERAALAQELGLLGLRKLRFSGQIRPDGAEDWRLDGTLGATVVQECVVTLAPVTTRIDMPVARRFLREMPEGEVDDAGEIEMEQDESIEPLGREIDIHAVMHEALALALPLYPRAEGADLDEAVFAGPGVVPMRDEDAKPFAGLADLRDRLTAKDGTDGSGENG